MEKEKFQELVLEQLAQLAKGQAVISDKLANQEKIIVELQECLTGVESKLNLVYDHVAKITESQTTNSKRITEIENDTSSLTELYGRHEVEIKNIKNILL